MKKKSFGKSESADEFARYHLRFSTVMFRDALKDYRENRENGEERDAHGQAFPSAGLDTLRVVSSTQQGSEKWPDEQGRYWWKLTCHEINHLDWMAYHEVNDFYCMEDKVRGYPDKDGCYWLTIHHAPSGTKIEGFSSEPDRVTGCPDKNGDYWSYVKYTECGAIKEWMEQKDRNYEARIEAERKEEARAAGEVSNPPLEATSIYTLCKLCARHPDDPLTMSLQLQTFFSWSGISIAGLDALKIKSSTYKPNGPKTENYYPDEQGRYWWRFTFEGGRVNEDFYWMEDKVRGYPDKNGCYWFTVHNALTGTKIEGFFSEPDRVKGYPDKNGDYWSYVKKYTECGAIKEWMDSAQPSVPPLQSNVASGSSQSSFFQPSALSYGSPVRSGRGLPPLPAQVSSSSSSSSGAVNRSSSGYGRGGYS